MAETETRWAVQNATVSLYQTRLVDKPRPPSKGGNTRAWHVHVLTISGERYSFLALGTKQWVYSGDTVSFEWRWNDESHSYRNIIRETIATKNKDGNLIIRGYRDTKLWRTADTRLPARRGEWRD